jgi:hypothetical protein
MGWQPLCGPGRDAVRHVCKQLTEFFHINGVNGLGPSAFSIGEGGAIFSTAQSGAR